MSQARSLPPIPILEDCPLGLLLDYAEAVLDPVKLKTRWTVALEVHREAARNPSGTKWFALVSLRTECRQLFTLLTRALKREVMIPHPRDSMETGTLKNLFRQMTTARATVWFFPLFQRRGAVIFVRKPADDPNLNRILRYNRRAQKPALKLMKMSVITRDRASGGKRDLVRAALHFQITDPTSFRRSARKK